jgi:succinyl-diaminopimelate desuccinylase
MDLIELATKLINFQSITGNEKEVMGCIDFCISYFNNIPNIFVNKVVNKNVPSVLIANCNTLELDVLDIGHIDVVPVSSESMFQPRIENGRMCARGAADMKSFVACGMQALEYVVKNDIKVKYGVLIVGDEETGSTCAPYWAKEMKLKTNIVLDGDSGGKLDRIIQKAKGFCFTKLTSIGKSGHGSMPWEGNDAIENLINVINNLRKIFPYFSEKNKPEDEWNNTMHVGTIKGGTTINAIAPSAEAEIDIRFMEKYDIDKIRGIIENSLVDGVKISYFKGGNVIFNKEEDKYLQLYKTIVDDIVKKTAKLDFQTGGTDARYFNDGNTTIIANQSDCGEIHSDGEWIDIKSLNLFLEIKKEFLRRVANYI